MPHLQVVATIGFLAQYAERVGAEALPGVNIGAPDDFRIPDVNVVDARPDDQVWFTGARLVVEIMSPGERAGAKVPFYAAHGVDEYLEIDPVANQLLLLALPSGERRHASGHGFATTDLAAALSMTDRGVGLDP